MSLSIRAKLLLSAALIVLLLVAPTVYSVMVLREISALTATLARRDAAVSVRVAELSDLFEQADRFSALLRPPYADPQYQEGLDRSLDGMQRRLDAIRTLGDPPIPGIVARAISALGQFREKAVTQSPDDAGLRTASGDVRKVLARLAAATRDVASRRTAEAEKLAVRAASLTLASAVGGFLLAAILGALLWRSMSRPLDDLAEGTERIGRGQFDRKIPVRADDELGRLAEAFNRMAEDLGELERMKAEFLATASHGLRTPLACVKGYVSSLRSGRQGALTDDGRRALDRMEEEVDRLTRFVDQLLDLGRLRAGRLPFAMREVPAAALFTSVGRSFDAMAEQRSIEYMITVEDGVPPRITADPDRLGEALINLLGNAFKYTPSGGMVSLAVRSDDGWVRVEVADSGPGIPAEDVPLIFEKFYRGGGVAAEGTGLGLAIARGIIERHGGLIWAESEEGKGARFIFRVPPQPPVSYSGRHRALGPSDSGARKAGAAALILIALACSGGCSWGRRPAVQPAPAEAAPAPSPAPVQVPPAPPPPAPGEKEMGEAAAAVDRGEAAQAIPRLEAVIAMGEKAPGRIDALLTLAILKAHPENPQRDPGAAMALLRQVVSSHPGGAKEAEAGLILSLLEQEQSLLKSTEDLRLQVEAAKGENEGLKSALAQREGELKKIKEILLGKTPGSP